MRDERNNGLHPRHPGRGCSTSLIRLESESGEVEVGGFLVFFPSGDTKVVQWRSVKPITPTLDAAKDYTSRLADELIKAHGVGHPDVQHTNWVSVCAAAQRIILDFNDGLTKAINSKMARDFMLPSEKRWRH